MQKAENARLSGNTLQERPGQEADAEQTTDAAVTEYIIGHEHFNKSLTLDVENRLMHFMTSNTKVNKLNNRRTNAQGKYYTADEFDQIFSSIWLELHKRDPEFFPSEEIIRDSALFKASPFHQLGKKQKQAEDAILEAIAEKLSQDWRESSQPQLIFLQGVAGTGKTVLLSHLFYRINTEFTVSGSDDELLDDSDGYFDKYSVDSSPAQPQGKNGLSTFMIINHQEQVNVYNQIAKKLGIQNKNDELIGKASVFINRMSESKPGSSGRAMVDANRHAIPNRKKPVDVVLIDEAHLLFTEGNQGYSGKNQLRDIVSRAKVVIAVFDPNQILRSSQRWDEHLLSRLLPPSQLNNTDPQTEGMLISPRGEGIKNIINFDGVDTDVRYIHLLKQFRISASDKVIAWIDDFASGRSIGKIPSDDCSMHHREGRGDKNDSPYEIRIFDSPVDLFRAIKKKEAEERKKLDNEKEEKDYCGLSRVVATYDWKYSSSRANPQDPHGYWNVEMHKDKQGHWLMGLEAGDTRGYLADGDNLSPDPDRFCQPWNYQIKDKGESKKAAPNRAFHKDDAWAQQPATIDEIG